MIKHILGRVFLALSFSLVLFIPFKNTAWAHALPASVIEISAELEQNQQLNLSLSLPIEDLIIAEPTLSFLHSHALDQKLAPNKLAELNTYFSKHLTLKSKTKDLILHLVSATLFERENDHVGKYKQLSLFFKASKRAKGDSKTALPLTLIYDGVMHEVRNHRAKVYLKEVNGETVFLAEFGFKKKDGAPIPIFLTRP